MIRVVYKILFVVLIVGSCFSNSFSKSNKANEKSYGININSNSYFIGGIDYKVKTSKNYFYNFEIVNVKHPNEIRFISGVTNSNIFGSRPYLVGKNNYLIALRGQKGYEKQLFRPAVYEGVGVKAIVAGGVTIGFLKPYFIKYENLSDKVVQEQYDPLKHSNFDRIQGPSGLFYGFENTKIRPGLNFKSALLFEYGGLKNVKSTIEAGFLLEMYPQKIEIMANARQEFLFNSVYLIIAFGKNKKSN